MFTKTDGAADVFEADGITHNRCLRKQTEQQMFQTTDEAADVSNNRRRVFCLSFTPGWFFCLCQLRPSYHWPIIWRYDSYTMQLSTHSICLHFPSLVHSQNVGRLVTPSIFNSLSPLCSLLSSPTLSFALTPFQTAKCLAGFKAHFQFCREFKSGYPLAQLKSLTKGSAVRIEAKTLIQFLNTIMDYNYRNR